MRIATLFLAAALAACAAPLAADPPAPPLSSAAPGPPALPLSSAAPALPLSSAAPALPLSSAAPAPPALPLASIELPETAPVILEPAARFECSQISESSGIVASRLQPGLYWTHNDSGDSARIFAVDGQGRSIQPPWVEDCPGIAVGDAVNIDWEDVAIDDQGNLIVAACGNNDNARRDLALYLVPEPVPAACSLTRIAARYRFRYPDQTAFPPPPEERNFDCEAVGWAGGHVYLLSKNRGDGRTKLYRFDELDPVAENVPALIGSFPVGGLVTAADIDPDGRRLAALTYSAVWLFTAPAGGDDYFGGAVAWLPVVAGQCEAICFDEGELVITSEQGQIFRLAIERLIQVR